MKSGLRVRIALAALVLVTGVVSVATLATPAQAMFTPGVCTYYSNAQHHTVVGQRGTGCCGEVISWGVVTNFRTCERYYCLDVWCGPPTE